MFLKQNKKLATFIDENNKTITRSSMLSLKHILAFIFVLLFSISSCAFTSFCFFEQQSKAAETELINPETGYPYPDHIINGSFEYGKDYIFSQTEGPVPILPFPKQINYKTGQFWNCTGAHITVWDFPTYNAQHFGWRNLNSNVVDIQQDASNNNCFSYLRPETPIYQDIKTIPGAKYQWKIKHSSSNPSFPISSIQVLIGAPNNTTAQPAYRTSDNGNGNTIGYVGTKITTNSTNKVILEEKSKSISYGNGWGWETYVNIVENGWCSYQGEYTVPAGQTITRFTFEGLDKEAILVKACSDSVDDIQFSILCPITFVDRLTNKTIKTVDVPAYTNAAELSATEIPQHNGHTFKGYSQSLENIQNPATIYLEYDKDPINLSIDVNQNDFGSTRISWNDYNSSNKSFKVYQSADNGTTWNSIGIDYKDVTEVRCLQIYPVPQAKGQLKTWIEANGYGKNIIKIDEVYLNDFNTNPEAYLKNTDGSWKYNVIYFGAWDSTNNKDLSSIAKTQTENFIASGRGVIFGHDTFSIDAFNPVNFISLGKYIGVSVSRYQDSIKSSYVTLTKKGILTNYPWNIENKTLEIPSSHPSQITSSDIWIKFSDANGNITYDNYLNTNNCYLAIRNNCAMIQTGHSMGASSVDEQKITTNLIFFMNQLIYEKNNLADKSAQDVTAPQINYPIYNHATQQLTLNSNDEGTKYQYKVESYDKNDTSAAGLIQTSSILEQVVTTNVKTIKYIFDNNPSASLDNVKTNGISMAPNSSINYAGHTERYIHTIAIDGAGNISEPYTISIPVIATPVQIPAFVKLSNNSLITTGEFGFDLFSSNNPSLLYQAGNSNDGTILFNDVIIAQENVSLFSIENNIPKYKTRYFVKQQNKADTNITYDAKVYAVDIITNDDNHDGVLNVENISYTEVNPLTFENIGPTATALTFENIRWVSVPELGMEGFDITTTKIGFLLLFLTLASVFARFVYLSNENSSYHQHIILSNKTNKKETNK